MSSVAHVESLTEKYKVAKSKHRKHGPKLVRIADYVKLPKADGYRSVHLIMDFRSTKDKRFNGQKIEVQIRSRLQHAWATAVETCQTFTGLALKSKTKSENTHWHRFFSLMSSAIASREQQPPVPGTPTDRTVLVEELRAIEEKEQIILTLTGWNESIKQQDVVAQDASAFLLVLNTSEKTLQITPFAEHEMLFAQTAYIAKEKSTEKSPEIQVVLVSVDTVSALKRAYPNYYVDTTVFIKAVEQELVYLERKNATR